MNTPARKQQLRAAHRRWKANHPEQFQEYRKQYNAGPLRKNVKLKSLYGITLEQYRALEIQQQGECRICGNPETEVTNGKSQRLSVDHDHVTGMVRGLICRNCNRGMGTLNDDPVYLRRCAEYLESYV